jgi:hypothetical protein
MSHLGNLYKQAHDLVLKKYQEEPEDAWKVNAIYRSRLGEKGHESTTFQFVKDVETQVGELLKSTPIAARVNNQSPNKKEVAISVEPIKPTTPP